MKIKQIYQPWWLWEDYHNGMWRKLPKSEEPEMLKKAIEFTGDHIKYGNAMKRAAYEWPNTMENTLTNLNVNRRAFLGHCACSLEFNCPEYITRMAWNLLTDIQRYLADKVAQKTINEWILWHESKDTAVYKNLGKQMLFQWTA